MTKLIKKIEKDLNSYTGRRLSVRSVDVRSCLEDALANAKKRGRTVAHAYHGGNVANAYNYPADTEALVVIAAPDGRITAETGRLPANKVTESGVAACCLGDWARPYFDDRFGPVAKRNAYHKLCRELVDMTD
jgi:hypothetical protein